MYISLLLMYCFKERVVEAGFRRAFKGNWGAEAHTKRSGVVQGLNRLSYNAFISHLRKINLPLDASAKVIGPRLLHGSQWGIIDPVDDIRAGNPPTNPALLASPGSLRPAQSPVRLTKIAV